MVIARKNLYERLWALQTVSITLWYTEENETSKMIENDREVSHLRGRRLLSDQHYGWDDGGHELDIVRICHLRNTSLNFIENELECQSKCETRRIQENTKMPH